MRNLLKHSLLLLLFFSAVQNADAQKVFEIGIKPTELAFLNFEMNAAFGKKKSRYGIILSYRPSTRDSGLVKKVGGGLLGTYGNRHLNRLYRMYTIGVNHKIYINQSKSVFIETDLYYRNWNFENKYARFNNNPEGYRFAGLRSENVDVYGLKVHVGKTFVWYRKDKKVHPFMDVYLGAGLRKQTETFETFNGTVRDEYHSYLKENYTYIWPTPQGGIRMGLLKARKND